MPAYQIPLDGLLGKRLELRHTLQDMPDDKIRDYLAVKLAAIPIQNFLTGVSLEDAEMAGQVGAEEEIGWVDDEG